MTSTRKCRVLAVITIKNTIRRFFIDTGVLVEWWKWSVTGALHPKLSMMFLKKVSKNHKKNLESPCCGQSVDAASTKSSSFALPEGRRTFSREFLGCRGRLRGYSGRIWRDQFPVQKITIASELTVLWWRTSEGWLRCLRFGFALSRVHHCRCVQGAHIYTQMSRDILTWHIDMSGDY